MLVFTDTLAAYSYGLQPPRAIYERITNRGAVLNTFFSMLCRMFPVSSVAPRGGRRVGLSAEVSRFKLENSPLADCILLVTYDLFFCCQLQAPIAIWLAGGFAAY